MVQSVFVLYWMNRFLSVLLAWGDVERCATLSVPGAADIASAAGLLERSAWKAAFTPIADPRVSALMTASPETVRTMGRRVSASVPVPSSPGLSS